MALRPLPLALLLVVAATTLARPDVAHAGAGGAHVPAGLATSGLPTLSPTPPEPLPAAPATRPRAGSTIGLGGRGPRGAAPTLPHTGFGLLAVAGAGGLLLAGGALARWGMRRRPRRAMSTTAGVQVSTGVQVSASVQQNAGALQTAGVQVSDRGRGSVDQGGLHDQRR